MYFLWFCCLYFIVYICLYDYALDSQTLMCFLIMIVIDDKVIHY